MKDIKKSAVAQLVGEYRKYTELSLRDFADELTKTLATYDESISYQAINNWEKGAYYPNPLTLLRLVYASGWVGDFAVDMLAIIDPKRYQPQSEIGRKVVERWKTK